MGARSITPPLPSFLGERNAVLIILLSLFPFAIRSTPWTPHLALVHPEEAEWQQGNYPRLLCTVLGGVGTEQQQLTCKRCLRCQLRGEAHSTEARRSLATSCAWRKAETSPLVNGPIIRVVPGSLNPARALVVTFLCAPGVVYVPAHCVRIIGSTARRHPVL